jgi:hypothetical protein
MGPGALGSLTAGQAAPKLEKVETEGDGKARSVAARSKKAAVDPLSEGRGGSAKPSRPADKSSNAGPRPDLDDAGSDFGMADEQNSKDGVGDTKEAEKFAPDKDRLWDHLSLGDSERRRGNCGAARIAYGRAIEFGASGLALARAHAGLGLCWEYEGETARAQDAYADARGANLGIDAFITSERARMPSYESKQKRTKSQDLAGD